MIATLSPLNVLFHFLLVGTKGPYLELNHFNTYRNMSSEF
jgi:hypothetical protein